MDENAAMTEMPRYQCHKKVWALRIQAVRFVEGDGVRLSFFDSQYARITKDDAWFNRFNPMPGDYYVVYEDGYASISPAKAFEDGYTRL